MVALASTGAAMTAVADLMVSNQFGSIQMIQEIAMYFPFFFLLQHYTFKLSFYVKNNTHYTY